jgi:uncharacterized protein (DUF1499 family)
MVRASPDSPIRRFAGPPMKLLRLLFFFALLAALLLLAAGQLGLLKGTLPTDLGVRDGKLRPPSRTDNSVSSQAHLYEGAGAQYARIEPIRFSGDGAAALTRIGAIVLKMPGARILQSGPDYLYVQFQTRWLKFVDDAEFSVDPAASVIHVRSAARIGRKDFGVNRARIESIRAAFATTP